MFTRAHHKHQSKPAGPGRERGSSAAPVSTSPEASLPSEPALSPDIIVDEAMLALDAEITSLAQLPVAQAAKERGWATLRRELDHRPVRVSSPALLKGTGAKTPLGRPASPVLAGHSRSWRVALGSAAAAVAIVAALLGTYAAGLLGGGDPSGPVASVTTSASAPESTVPTDRVTVSTETPESTTPTETTPTTGSTGTTVESPPSTTGGSTPPSPPTTKPAQTTTTGEEQMAAAQRVKTAEAAALELGDAVVLYFLGSGDLSGLRALVASSAQAALTQMISSLTEPYGSYLVTSQVLSATSVRVTVAFNDRVPDGQGVLTETIKTFRLTVRTQAGGATITAISAGS